MNHAVTLRAATAATLTGVRNGVLDQCATLLHISFDCGKVYVLENTMGPLESQMDELRPLSPMTFHAMYNKRNWFTSVQEFQHHTAGGRVGSKVGT